MAKSEENERTAEITRELHFTWGRIQSRIGQEAGCADLMSHAKKLIKNGADTTGLTRLAKALAQLGIKAG
jgi:hypothetical protein